MHSIGYYILHYLIYTFTHVIHSYYACGMLISSFQHAAFKTTAPITFNAECKTDI